MYLVHSHLRKNRHWIPEVFNSQPTSSGCVIINRYTQTFSQTFGNTLHKIWSISETIGKAASFTWKCPCNVLTTAKTLNICHRHEGEHKDPKHAAPHEPYTVSHVDDARVFELSAEISAACGLEALKYLLRSYNWLCVSFLLIHVNIWQRTFQFLCCSLTICGL